MESEVSDPDPKHESWEDEDTDVSGPPDTEPPPSPAETDEPDTLVVDRDTWEEPAEAPTANDEDGDGSVPDEVTGEGEADSPTLVDEP